MLTKAVFLGRPINFHSLEENMTAEVVYQQLQLHILVGAKPK